MHWLVCTFGVLIAVAVVIVIIANVCAPSIHGSWRADKHFADQVGAELIELHIDPPKGMFKPVSYCLLRIIKDDAEYTNTFTLTYNKWGLGGSLVSDVVLKDQPETMPNSLTMHVIGDTMHLFDGESSMEYLRVHRDGVRGYMRMVTKYVNGTQVFDSIKDAFYKKEFEPVAII